MQNFHEFWWIGYQDSTTLPSLQAVGSPTQATIKSPGQALQKKLTELRREKTRAAQKVKHLTRCPHHWQGNWKHLGSLEATKERDHYWIFGSTYIIYHIYIYTPTTRLTFDLFWRGWDLLWLMKIHVATCFFLFFRLFRVWEERWTPWIPKAWFFTCFNYFLREGLRLLKFAIRECTWQMKFGGGLGMTMFGVCLSRFLQWPCCFYQGCHDDTFWKKPWNPIRWKEEIPSYSLAFRGVHCTWGWYRPTWISKIFTHQACGGRNCQGTAGCITIGRIEAGWFVDPFSHNHGSVEHHPLMKGNYIILEGPIFIHFPLLWLWEEG